MHAGLSSESANWILPSYPTTETPGLASYEEALPFRVNHEGAKNYLRNRGSLNIGGWAVEGRRPSTAKSIAPIEQELYVAQPKVLGPDALRNYTKSRSTTPNLIYGTLQPAADAHQQMRVRREGLPNYERNHNTQMKGLLENYGKSPLPAQPAPHTQGQVDLLHFHPPLFIRPSLPDGNQSVLHAPGRTNGSDLEQLRSSCRVASTCSSRQRLGCGTESSARTGGLANTRPRTRSSFTHAGTPRQRYASSTQLRYGSRTSR